MGGGWDTEFINYVEFDLFTCADGIDYDENNINCSTYEHIMEAAGEDNSFSMDVYYPVVHYQPLNKTNSIFVRYDNFFYHLSRFSNKIDRIYLQQHILKDDDGLLTNNEKNISFWGVMSLSGDNYANGEGKDLMNEGSFSRLYSFNIYLNFDVIYYHRYYKKLFFIIADGLPFVTGIFSICEIIAKILKISSENEKLIELLFEERQTHESKSIKIENNILEMNQSNNIIENKDISQKDIIYINSPKSQNKRIFQNFQNKNQMISKLNNSNLSSSKLILPNKDRHFTARNNKKIASLFNPQEGLQRENYNVKIDKTVDDKQCKNKKLFPFKYYLYTAFVNNVHKNSSFFSEKFIEVYKFICQLMDISSYIILQREFEILKSTLVINKYRDIIENSKKINVLKSHLMMKWKNVYRQINLIFLEKQEMKNNFFFHI